jgi:hypothetical protein
MSTSGARSRVSICVNSEPPSRMKRDPNSRENRPDLLAPAKEITVRLYSILDDEGDLSTTAKILTSLYQDFAVEAWTCVGQAAQVRLRWGIMSD